MDEYRPASFRAILLTLVAVIAGVTLSWQIASWGLNAMDAPPAEFAPQQQQQAPPGSTGSAPRLRALDTRVGEGAQRGRGRVALGCSLAQSAWRNGADVLTRACGAR